MDLGSTIIRTVKNEKGIELIFSTELVSFNFIIAITKFRTKA